MADSTLPRHIVGPYQAETVVCENVPIERCPNCGQIYFPSHVAELFEKTRQGEVKPDHTVTLEVGACAVDQWLALT
jgi:YgiT-type zinc finger domain-containing protein